MRQHSALSIIRLLFITSAFGLFSLGLRAADTVFLRGGEKLIGKVVSDDKDKVVFESQALGKLTIPRERVERVEFEPASTPTPPAAPANEVFVPPPPQPTSPMTATNNLARGWWFWPFKEESDKTHDWIQLKSGEWLRGKLHGMQNRTVEFESDELDDLSFDWKDVHQLIMPEALVSFGERESAWGKVRMDRENVTVTGGEEVTFPRYDLVGIAPGSPREIDYWSGRLNVGVNIRSGNTEQIDLVTKAKVERRTPDTHLEVDYVGNYSKVEGTETVNNQRVTESFDIFLTRRLFLRVPQAEYYTDFFQNIDARYTAGGGVGYYLIDTPKTEWLIAGGPGYRHIRFDTVQPGEPETEDTPAALLQSSFEIELTKRTDFELDYQLIIANQASGGATQHLTASVEIDLTSRLDLDLAFIWDRIGNPQTDASGAVPERDDFRLNLSLGVKF